MNAIVTKVSAFLFICCFCLEMAQAQWIGDPASTLGAVWVSMDVDSEGVPYVAYDVGGMMVSRRIDGEWAEVGGVIGSTGGSVHPYVKVDRNDVPYIAYQDGGHGNMLVVKRFNGTDWETVGSGETATDHGVRYSYINFDNNNIPHVFYRDIGSNKGRVIRLEDGDWVQLGPNVSGKASDFASLTFSSDNVPYVGYHDEENGWGVTVKRFNGMDWELVGPAGFSSGGGVHNPFLALDNNDVPHVLFHDVSLDKAVVMRFSGSAWEYVGPAGFSVGSVRAKEGTNKLYFGLDNRPYVSFSDAGVGKGVFMTFDGTDWSLVGGAAATPNGAAHYGSAMDRENGILYFGYRNGSDGGRRAFVYEFHCNPTFSAQPENIEVDDGQNASFIAEAHGDGVTYQWYVDRNDGNGPVLITDDATYTGTTTNALQITGATVAMNGYEYSVVAASMCGQTRSAVGELRVIPQPSSWVGGPATTLGAVWVSVDVDSEGLPYVAYDVGGMMVSRRIDGEWAEVGGVIGSTGGSVHPYVKVDRNDVPYIAYQDGGHGNMLVVKRFNGTDWEAVGSGETATDHAVRYSYINFDNDNIPHVFYRDIGSNKGRVIRLEGGEWVQLGPNVSGKAADFASLAFSSDNVPYVGYHDEENGWGVTVKRFNGTDWEPVGSVSFSSGGGVHNPFLALDNDDIPHVLFHDVALDRAVVMRFNGTTWEYVGPAGFSTGGVRAKEGTNKLYFGLDNRPYVSFSDGGPGVFMTFDGTDWSLVGGTAATPNGAAHYGSAMDRGNGVLYFGYRNGSDGGRRAFVYEFKVGPQISVSPKDVTIVEGDNVALKGVAAGSALNYQWQVDKNDGAGFVNLAEDATYSNTRTPKLQITFATNAMDGHRYRMVAIGENGAAATKSAVLTVLPSDFCYPAVIVAPPTDVSACPDTEAVFTVDATGSDLIYQWQMSTNGIDFFDILDDATYGGAATATLSIHSVVSSMHGNLYRVVVGACDEAVVANNVALEVYPQPVIVTEPQTPEWLCLGSSTALEVVAEGDGLFYQWELDKGDGFEALADEGIYAGTTTAMLAIADVSADMNGYAYRVVISGTCEPAPTSQIITLPVYQPLVGGTIEGEQVICANAIASELSGFEGASGEEGPYSYQWQFSKDNAIWEDIVSAETPSYAPGAIAESTYFRRMVVSSTTCGTMAFSNTVLVRVTDELTAGEIKGDQNIRYGSIPPQPFVSVKQGFGGEGVLYQWESSTNGVDFEAIPNAIAKDYNPPSPVYQTTYYRRRAIAVLGCGTALSNTVKVVVFQHVFEEDKIPNVLFPNGNIKNRTWGVSHMGLTGAVKICIFNRNGQVIFKSETAEKEWDGTYKGEFVPAGSYFYSIEDQEGSQVSGTIKVIY